MRKSMQRIFLFAGALTLCAPAILGQRPRPADDVRAAQRPVARPKPQPNAAPAPKLSTSSWEFWYNLVIAPGDAMNLDSGLNYAACDTVRVTVRSANGDLADLTLSAYWAVPELQMFNNSEVVTGDHFFYNNVGGAVFDTYGTQFRLRLTNTGSGTITLTQVTVFAHNL